MPTTTKFQRDHAQSVAFQVSIPTEAEEGSEPAPPPTPPPPSLLGSSSGKADDDSLREESTTSKLFKIFRFSGGTDDGGKGPAPKQLLEDAVTSIVSGFKETSEKVRQAAQERKQLKDPTRDRKRQAFYMRVVFCIIPTALSVWWAAAIFFEPGDQAIASAILWDPGLWISANPAMNITWPSVIPKPSLAAEGYFQILCLVFARLSAFALYVAMGNTFLTKCHGLTNILSRTMCPYYMPLERFHSLHRFTGLTYAYMAGVHTVAHLARYAARNEWSYCGTVTGVTGILSAFLMILVVTPMYWSRLKEGAWKLPFETRIFLHWMFLPMSILLYFHHPRTFYIMFAFTAAWLLDYLYVFFFRTYRIDYVEFTAVRSISSAAEDEKNAARIAQLKSKRKLSEEEAAELMKLEEKVVDGVQILWRNPPGFRPRAGEFVKILIPWLEDTADPYSRLNPNPLGDEWHAFSLYQREETSAGLELHNDMVTESVRESERQSARAMTERMSRAMAGGGGRSSNADWNVRVSRAARASQVRASINYVPGSPPTIAEEDEAVSAAEEGDALLAADDINFAELVRYGLEETNTTQIFVSPIGDWSKALSNTVLQEERTSRILTRRSLWVRGPFTSPYSISHRFSNLILFASGIGITPALGVLDQYYGDRNCIVVWMLRSEAMLTFFTPLLAKAKHVIVYYTDKKKLTDEKVKLLKEKAPIIMNHNRPDLDTIIPAIVEQYSKLLKEGDVPGAAKPSRFSMAVKRMSLRKLAISRQDEKIDVSAWCAMYCGGSFKVKDQLRASARKLRIGWEAELFDW